MKTIKELREYYEDFKKNHNNRAPIVKEYSDDMTITNAVDTPKFHPWKWGKNGSWLDYWRAFAYKGVIRAEILTCSNTYRSVLYGNHNNIIVGGHVVVDNDCRVYYIIPICSICNSKHGEKLLHIHLGTKMVAMADPVIIRE